jgi:hypothetical protein
VRCYFDSGAYTRLSSYAVVKCTAHIPGPYTIPNVHADVYCVFTNRTPATAMRGFGVTALDFALECQMDKLAVAVGMDPLEFRILNAYRDGDMKAHRREAKNCALIECAQVAAEKPIGRCVMSSAGCRRGKAAARSAPVAAPIVPPRTGIARRRAPSDHLRRCRSASPTNGQNRPPPAQTAAGPPPPRSAPPPPPHRPARRTARRVFSSVFGTRRR